MDGEKILIGVLLTCLGCLILSIPLLIIDELYLRPIADERANIWCRYRGYDYFKSYSRMGILSQTPMAIKCQFVEQARKVDLNVNGGIE